MNIYKKLFRYVPEAKGHGYTAIFFSAVSAFLTVYGYYCIYRFLDTAIVENNLELSKVFAVKTAVFLTCGAVFYIVSGMFSHLLGFRLETNLRKKGIDGLTKASFRFFDLNPSGAVRKTIDDNAAKTHQIVAHMIPDNSQAFLVPVFAIILGFTVSVRVGVLVVILSLFGILILKGMIGGGEFMKIYQEALQTLSSETVEYVRGMQVIKIFGADIESFKALYKAIKDYSKYAYEYSLSCKKSYVNYQWLFFGIIAIILVPLTFFKDGNGTFAILGNIRPETLIVELIMVFFLAGIMFVSFMRIMWVSMYVYQANFAVDNLERLYSDMKKDSLVFGNETEIENFDIEFENVTFGYNDKKVISDLSFKLEEGRSYALVGSSGSGKSTIAKLISGFYKVDGGDIKIGGKPLQSYTQETLIKSISFVFQDAKLFKKSIYDNVSLANKNASREEVMNALKLAGCDVIIEKFPERENTVIGSKGVYLSGGERQRIAIARAILKNSKIVIMDEASAAIDPDNEHELQKAFKNLMNEKTVIMIAHRLSSIRAVDEIIVLDNGKITERGNDSELMEKNSRYRELVNLYNSANEWRVCYE